MTALVLNNNTALAEKLEMIELQNAKSIADFAKNAFAYPTLTKEEERELAIELRDNGTRQAFEALFFSHARQVVAIASGYSGYGLPKEDLVQEGSIGLAHAIKKFDPDRGFRLSTYAVHWIKSYIGDYIIKNWRIVKTATTAAQRKLFFSIRSIAAKIGRRLDSDDAERIAEELDVKSSDVLEMEKRMLLPQVDYDNTNLDDDDNDKSPAATLVADDGRHAEEIVIDGATAQSEHEALHAALDSLNDRERRIIEARALSESGKDIRLHELAEELGVSTERVRQLEIAALTKIKNYVRGACTHLN